MGEKLLKIYELGLKYTKTNVQRVPWTKYLQRHQILNVVFTGAIEFIDW